MENIKEVIMMAKNKKEAIELMDKQYGNRFEYVKPYKYASKGNNFYQFNLDISNPFDVGVWVGKITY